MLEITGMKASLFSICDVQFSKQPRALSPPVAWVLKLDSSEDWIESGEDIENPLSTQERIRTSDMLAR